MHDLAPDSEVRNEDWGGDDLGDATFTRVTFVEVDMSETVTAGAVFEECTFRGVKLNVSEHKASAFLNCTFARCNFFDVTFTGCKLLGSRFEECSLDLLKVDGGDWSYVSLRGANLSSATISDTRMREVDLSSVQAQGGALRDLDLSGASFSKANLTTCDLRGSDLSSLDPGSATLKNAIITFEQAAVLMQAQGLDVRPV